MEGERSTTAIEIDVAVLKADVATVKTDVHDVKKDVSEVKGDVKTLLIAQAASSGAHRTMRTIALQLIPFIALIVSIAAVLQASSPA